MTYLQGFASTLRRMTGERRAIVDTPAGAPSPLQPIDLTDDASVSEVLDLAVRVGEVTLAAGTGAIDTANQVQFIASTYGLARCDVDVTYNSIVISAYRGPTLPPERSGRRGGPRSHHEGAALSGADTPNRNLSGGRITPHARPLPPPRRRDL